MGILFDINDVESVYVVAVFDAASGLRELHNSLWCGIWVVCTAQRQS
jgi:hypothetical protein